MEAVALVQAIGALASSGLSIAKTIAQLVEDLREANSQIAMIGIDTKAVAIVLETLKTRLNEFPYGMSNASREVMDVAGDVEAVCRREIEEIERTIQPLIPAPGAKSLTISQKRKWLFAKSGVASRRASLDTLKLTLNLLLAGIDIRGHYGPPPTYLKDRVTQLVEETKNTKAKLKIAEKTDKDTQRSLSKHEVTSPQDTHDSSTDRLDEPAVVKSPAVSVEPKTNGVNVDVSQDQRRIGTAKRSYTIHASTVRASTPRSDNSSETGSDDDTYSSQDEDADRDNTSAVTPWTPQEHWQAKVKEQLRVQREVVRFADTALVLYQDPNANSYATTSGSHWHAPYQSQAYGGVWPDYGQARHYQPQSSAYYVPPPLETLPSPRKLSVRNKSEDPGLLEVREQLRQLQLERQKADEARERAELERKIRDDQEKKSMDMMEALRRAEADAKRQVELARAAAEKAAADRLEVMRQAEEERRLREAELRAQIVREERERVGAERMEEEKKRLLQEAMLQKASLEARDVVKDAVALSTKAKDKEIKDLSAQLTEAQGKVLLTEAQLREEREGWLKEKYELKEQVLKARTDTLAEVHGNYDKWASLRPEPGPIRIYPRPIPHLPPRVTPRGSSRRGSSPVVSIRTETSSASSRSCHSIHRFWRFRYWFEPFKRKTKE